MSSPSNSTRKIAYVPTLAAYYSLPLAYDPALVTEEDAREDSRIELAKLGRGAIVGEIAILCDVPRTATVTSTGKTVTLRISKELFFRLIEEFPQIAVEVMRELAHRLENTNLQLREARAGKPH